MSLTYQQIALVRSTFAKIQMRGDTVAAYFYRRLFELDPFYRELVVRDMRAYGRTLLDMIEIVVDNLEQLDVIIPMTKRMVTRHIAYGMTADDYEAVGCALLWAFHRSIGADFTPDARAAWAATYGMLANTAIDDYYSLN